MINSHKFLTRAPKASEVISESKLLDIFSQFNKAIILNCQSFEDIINSMDELVATISKLPQAKINYILVNPNKVLHINSEVDKNISGVDFNNLVLDKSCTDACISLGVFEGIKVIAENGRFTKEVELCLEKTKTMQDKLNVLKPVSGLKEVFDTFMVECKHQKSYYDKCFSASGKIKAEIKEQELRNILLEYLQKNIKGEIFPEYCTSYKKDEESVDIYLNDGVERAIIEVKFSFTKEWYEGKSFYRLEEKSLLGIEQLNRYAIHLKKDGRLPEYGFVYVFYHNGNDKKLKLEAESAVNNKIYSGELSEEFYSIYQKLVFNNLALWNT
ncbi:TPA: hypothetical protein ACGO3V_002031 [Streptococcus suis]